MKTVIPMDSVLGALFAIGGVAILFVAMGYAPIAGMSVGPGLFPSITGGAMVLFGVVLAVQAWLLRNAVDEDEGDVAPPPFVTMFAIAIVVAILAVILLMPFLGFLVGGVLFSIAIVRMSGGKWLSAIIFSPIATYAIYAMFTYGFRVPLPRGLLG